MFSVADRNRVRDQVIQLARSDPRIVGAAVVGGLAYDEGDRWSDLDLTFAVENGVSIRDLLEEWTRTLVSTLDAVHLFDVSSGTSIYRMFLLPGCLQFDLSMTPASDFGAIGPKFRLLFGKVVEKPLVQAPSAQDLFGHAVHHALRARVCIERGRFWQAEYWISGVRDQALSLACRRRNLPARDGRGFDDLPEDVRDRFASAMVTSLTRDALLNALASAIDGLFSEASEVQELAARVQPQLKALTEPWS
jgi:hypothetical protein